jgi:hypothetical protein
MKQDFSSILVEKASQYAANILPKDADYATEVYVKSAYMAGAFFFPAADANFLKKLLAKDKTGDTIITIDAANVFFDLYERLSARQKTYVRDYIIRDADTSELTAELSRRGFDTTATL